MRYLTTVLAIALATSAHAAAPTCDTASGDLTAQFLHDRVWLTPRIGGREIRVYTDTGGGWNAIGRSVVAELGLPTTSVPGDDGEPMTLVDFPTFDAGCQVTAPPGHFMDGRLMVADDKQLMGAEAFLGGRWFADGRWEFDYPQERLRRLAGEAGNPEDPHRVALGFQTNAAGERTMHFPSLDVTVDGESLPMLLDTGATATLTPTSAPVFGQPVGTDIGTSFIESEVFERWHRKHPDWRVLEAADLKGKQARRMIQVPEIEVAGQRVGPVWFAEQPPGSFTKYMASMMDRPTWGALGGSGLRHFRLRIDYPAAAAYFHIPGEDVQPTCR